MPDDPFRVQEPSDRRLRVGRDRHQWVEGNFVAPDITDEHAVLYSQTDGYMGTVLQWRQMVQLAIALAVAAATLIGRAGWLQIAQGAEFSRRSDVNRLRTEYVYADRGLIYDRFQQPLVRNVPSYVVTLRPRSLPADVTIRRETLTKLYRDHIMFFSDKTLDGFIAEIEAARQNPALLDKDIPVGDAATQDQAVILQLLAKDLPALRVQATARRDYLTEGPTGGASDDTEVYPAVQSLSHLLGYMTRLQPGEYESREEEGYLFNDRIGRTGLEASFEHILRGSHGKKEIEVDAQGRFKQVLHQSTPNDGLSVQTSLDLELQRAIEAALRNRLNAAEKQAASVVALDPNTGDVLAMVSLPTYDNNLFSIGLNAQQAADIFQNPAQPLFNRAIAGEYPSGSTFKPIVAAAALEEGIVTQRTSYLSVGGIRINDFYFPDWKAGGHGQTNVYKAIAESVNTYFYIIGGGYQNIEGLGVTRMTDYAKRFGLSKPLGIDIPGESAGFLPSREWKEAVKQERWYVGDTYHLAIGQGDLLVTPLQMAASIAAFANGGTLYKPKIVSSILDENLRTVESIAPTTLTAQVAPADVLQIVRAGLRQVVTIGSGRRLSDLPVAVSGKTGTAQWHSQKDPHAWFVGYAPAQDPKIAFAILIEEGNEGSDLPVTIAHDFISWWSANRR